MSSAVGKRYACALFEVASERGKIDQVEADLGAIVQAVEGNEDLKRSYSTRTSRQMQRANWLKSCSKAM